MSNLHFRRVTTNARCPRCAQANEDLTHVYLACPWLSNVWQHFGINWISPMSQTEFTGQLATLFIQSDSNRKSLILVLLWAIWSNRNKMVHDRKQIPGSELIQFVISYHLKCSTLNSVASTPSPKRVIKWSAPSAGRLKPNFDASFDHHSKIAGSGMVLRDSLGNFVAAKVTFHHNVANPFTAELLACKDGFDFANGNGYVRFDLEGDSLNIIKRLKSPSPDFTTTGFLMDHLKNVLRSIPTISTHHIPRTANGVAHRLARHAIQTLQTESWFEEPPDFLTHLLQADI